MSRCLMVLTNAGAFPGQDEGSAGWYLPECAHPYSRFVKAGMKVDFASINGGETTVCKSSIDLTDAENKAFWEDAALVKLTNTTKKLSDCKSSDYDVLFYVGGFGTMYDFPLDKTVMSLTQEMYEADKVVGAVCHGPIALMNVKLSNGKYLVEGKEVAGFTNDEEKQAGCLEHLPMHWKEAGQTCEDILTARGAKFTKTDPWGAHVAVSGKLITGPTPGSAGVCADAIVKAASQ
jgi:putative intracellular protease/amidase